MAVLLCLAERPGEVLTKQEIFVQVWPDSHVGDDVLANAIWELRKAFKDKAREPSYIQTIHRRGYRLIADVVRETTIQKTPPAPLPASSSSDVLKSSQLERSISLWRSICLVALLLLVLVLGLVAFSRLRANHLTVAVRRFDSGEAVSSSLGSNLRQSLRDQIGQLPYVQLLDLSLFARAKVSGAVRRHPDKISIEARVHDLPKRGDEIVLIAEDRPENIDLLIEQLFLDLRVILETQGDVDLRDVDRTEKAIYFLETGQAFHRRGEFDHAIPYLEKAAQLDDRQLEAFDLLANIYHVYGYDDKALLNIERALELAREQLNAEPLAFARRKAQILGDTETEREILLELRLRYPNDFTWSFKLAWFKSTHFRDCQESLRLFEDATWGAGEEDMFAYRAETLLICKGPQDAIDLLMREWKFEKNARYYEQLAKAQRLAGDYAGARNSLFKARDLGSEIYPLLDGQLAMAQGWYELASTYFKDFLHQASWPNAQAQGLLSLAKVELLKGQNLDLAEQYVRQAMVYKPQEPLAFWLAGLIWVERALGAEEAAERDIRLLRAETNRRHLLAACCSERSRYREEFAHHLEGQIQLAQGNHAAAVRSFQSAIDLNPYQRSFFLTSKAEAFLQKGDLEKARQAFAEVFRFNPNHPRARCLLGRTLALEKRFEAAQEQFEHCLSIYGDQPQDPVGKAAAAWLFQLRTSS